MFAQASHQESVPRCGNLHLVQIGPKSSTCTFSIQHGRNVGVGSRSAQRKGQREGEGRPGLTPVGFGWAKYARSFPLYPILWMRAVLVAKRLEYFP